MPLISLADKYENKNITFIYTVKKDKQLLYPEKFSQWNERENFSSYTKHGRLTAEELREQLPLAENCSYIIAGPMTMNRAYTKYLKSEGIKANKIYYEGFNF